MVFGRRKGFLPAWGAKRQKADDPDFVAKTKQLEVMQQTLRELDDNMRLYLSSWRTMCKASEAIGEGLAKLAGEDGAEGKSQLLTMVRAYQSAQDSVNGVRAASQRVADETVLREMGAVLSRFPPIFDKIDKRRQLLAEVEAAEAKVRAAEAAREKEKDSFAVVTGNEQRKRVAAALETASSVAEGMTQEVVKDVDSLREDRRAMLVPQVSALVGCQAFFVRRSAAVLERLATQLPYSALALCRLVRPCEPDRAASTSSLPAPSMTPRTSSLSSTSTSDRHLLPAFDVDSGGRLESVALDAQAAGGGLDDGGMASAKRTEPGRASFAVATDTASIGPLLASRFHSDPAGIKRHGGDQDRVSMRDSPPRRSAAPPPCPPRPLPPVPPKASALSVILAPQGGTEERRGEGLWGVEERDDWGPTVEDNLWPCRAHDA